MGPLAQGLSQGCSQGANCGLISNLSWERICIQAPVVLRRIYFLMGLMGWWSDFLAVCLPEDTFTSLPCGSSVDSSQYSSSLHQSQWERESTSKTVVTVLKNVIMEVIFLCHVLLVRSIAPVIPRIKGRWLLLGGGNYLGPF